MTVAENPVLYLVLAGTYQRFVYWCSRQKPPINPRDRRFAVPIFSSADIHGFNADGCQVREIRGWSDFAKPGEAERMWHAVEMLRAMKSRPQAGP